MRTIHVFMYWQHKRKKSLPTWWRTHAYWHESKLSNAQTSPTTFRGQLSLSWELYWVGSWKVLVVSFALPVFVDGAPAEHNNSDIVWDRSIYYQLFTNFSLLTLALIVTYRQGSRPRLATQPTKLNAILRQWKRNLLAVYQPSGYSWNIACLKYGARGLPGFILDSKTHSGIYWIWGRYNLR